MNVTKLLVKKNWQEIYQDMQRENNRILYFIIISFIIYLLFTIFIEYGPIIHNDFRGRGLIFSFSGGLSFSIEYILIFAGCFPLISGHI